MPDTNTQPRWLNAEQVAARYGCGRVTVYRMVKRGQIPAPVQFSGRMSRWDVNGLNAADEARTAQKNPPAGSADGQRYRYGRADREVS
jgi:predicted DNA-binding transcriptional regulator AlpA